MPHVDVVVVADRGDSHGDRVIAAVEDLDASATRLTASTLADLDLVADPGSGMTVESEGVEWRIDHKSTVWWRRPGSPQSLNFNDDEGRLIADELIALLPGVLAAAQVRWVDAPWVLFRARLKPLQLATAHQLGIPAPRSVVTGKKAAAEQFASSRSVVAKALSSGQGIAPFVDVVPSGELWRVENCPTLLQELVLAESDLRVVTIGKSCFSWLRERDSGSQYDWRAVDPAGQGFEPTPEDPTEGQASALAEALGLTFSVQDWLLTNDSTVFLELNAQGQWLFLKQSDPIVVSALAQHLVGSL